MYIERLGIDPVQQSLVDNIFIDTTLGALNQKAHYWERAALVCQGDLANELESIQKRSYNEAHNALIKEDKITPVIIQLMGKLAFIDTLALPSSQILDPKQKAIRALGDYANRRRLFTAPPVEPPQKGK
jgi:hypothetical protein